MNGGASGDCKRSRERRAKPFPSTPPARSAHISVGSARIHSVSSHHQPEQDFTLSFQSASVVSVVSALSLCQYCQWHQWQPSGHPPLLTNLTTDSLTAPGARYAASSPKAIIVTLAGFGVLPVSTAHCGDVRCSGRPHGRTPAEGRRPTFSTEFKRTTVQRIRSTRLRRSRELLPCFPLLC
jgi:hypothetical protein